MEAVLNMETKIVSAELEMNNKMVRNMVLDSYNDMKEGKGRLASDFFDELEEKYQNETV